MGRGTVRIIQLQGIGHAPHVDAKLRSSVADTPSLALDLESQPGPQSRETLKTSQPDRVEYEWVPMTMDAKFRPRDGAGALTFRGRMWLLGGWNSQDLVNFPRHCINEVHSSRDGIEWTLVKPNTFITGHGLFRPNEDWEGRHTAGYAVLNDKLWIIGGDVNQGHYHYDVWNSEGRRTMDPREQGDARPMGASRTPLHGGPQGEDLDPRRADRTAICLVERGILS